VNVGISTKTAEFDSLENKTPVGDSNDAHALFIEYEVDESNTTLTVDEKFNITDDYQYEYTDESEYDDEYEPYDDYYYYNDEPYEFEPYWNISDSGLGNEINVTIGETPVP
jgi:hypothetical protein